MYQNKPLKLVNLTVCSLVLLSACQTSSNADSSIKSYLKAVHSGNTQEQKDLRCVT
jgi:CHAT domain-containing protein